MYNLHNPGQALLDELETTEAEESRRLALVAEAASAARVRDRPATAQRRLEALRQLEVTVESRIRPGVSKKNRVNF